MMRIVSSGWKERRKRKWKKEGIAEYRTKDDGSFFLFPYFLLSILDNVDDASGIPFLDWDS